MPSSNIVVPCPDELREALETEAAKRKIAKSALVRLAIAKEIGFDIKKANTRSPRTSKYGSPEERKEATRQRQKTRRELERKLIDMVNSGEHEEAVAALARSLAKQIRRK